MLSIDVMLRFIRSENKFQSALFRLNFKIGVGVELTLVEGLMGVLVVVKEFCDSEIKMGK